MKICVNKECGLGFDSVDNRQKYCSKKCRINSWYQRAQMPGGYFKSESRIRTNKLNLQKIRKAKKQRGECYACPNLAIPGEVLCLKHKLSNKEVRSRLCQEKILQGVCTRCDRLSLLGKTVCPVHVSRDSVRRKLRKVSGLCIQCGIPSVRGTIRCDLHGREHNKETVTRIKSSPVARIIANMRSRLRSALRASQAGKTVSAFKDLGCDIQQLRLYLEHKFWPGMSWDNYGKKSGWVIDHIIPFSAIDVTKRNELLKIIHFTNLQPLWWDDNLIKSDRVDWSSEESNHPRT